MMMEEAVRRVRQLCPDATYTSATITFDFNNMGLATSRMFSLIAVKHSSPIYQYGGSGSCWNEAVEKLAVQVQGTQDLKETIDETNGKQG